jgi:hypothetical protein
MVAIFGNLCGDSLLRHGDLLLFSIGELKLALNEQYYFYSLGLDDVVQV